MWIPRLSLTDCLCLLYRPGETLHIEGLDKAGRKRVHDTIRNYDELSTVLTTESIGFDKSRWMRVTKQPADERYYCHHFQQYILVDKEQTPRAFLLTSANLSSFAWGDQCQCGEELPSFGLVLDREKRGESDVYNAQTPSHDFWMRNFEFGIMDLHPERRKGRAACVSTRIICRCLCSLGLADRLCVSLQTRQSSKAEELSVRPQAIQKIYDRTFVYEIDCL